MFQEEVTNKSGVTKVVVASSQEELDEQVKAVKAEEVSVGPDITVPGNNEIVSPDNLGVEPIPSVVDNSVETPVEEDEGEKIEVKKTKSKK